MRSLRRYFLWTFFLGAVGLLGGLLLLARNSAQETPRSAYELALRSAFGPDQDPEAAFTHLRFALRGAEAENDHELIQDVLKARARLYTRVGSLTRARIDYEEVLARHRPDDLESQIALAWILIQLEEDDEAMRRVDAVLARDPGNSQALAFRGEVLIERAQENLDRAIDTVNVALAESLRDRAASAIIVSSALLPSDPQRIRLVQELREHFPASEGRQLQIVLHELDQATDRVRSAREALVQSFAGQVTTDTMSAFFRLLDRSGPRSPALDFALAAVQQPGIPANPALLQRLLEILRQRGLQHIAADLVAMHLGGNVPGPAFYRIWCKVLYEDERWQDLIGVAKAMGLAGTAADRSVGLFYVGVAQARLGRYGDALQVLRPYVLQSPEEPFPGAIALSWQLIAACYQDSGKPIDEAGALRAALLNGRVGLENEGELWLRLFELADADPSPSKNRLELERELLSAMSFLPERTPELLPRWEVVGQRNLDAARIDLRLVFEELSLDPRARASQNASPYEVYQLAQMFEAQGKHAGVIQNCSALLSDYPGFIPAIDMSVRAHLALGPRGQAAAAQLLLERVRLLGPDEETLDLIGNLQRNTLMSEQILELMRLDPEHYGRRLVLGHLRQNGGEREAVAGLLALPREALSDEDRLMCAQFLLQLGRADEVADVLGGLSEDPELAPRRSTLQLMIALELDDMAGFDAELDRLDEASGDPLGLLGLFQPLLARNDAARALRVALLLDDRDGPSSGRALLQLAQARMLLGEWQAGEEHLARAEAFLADGSAEVGYMVRTVAERDWGALPERVGDVQGSGMAPNPIGAALLDVLAERHSSAALRISEGISRQPNEPLWYVLRTGLAAIIGEDISRTLPGWSEESDRQLRVALRGPTGIERDPRELLVSVLCLVHPTWQRFAVFNLERTPLDAEGGLWPAFLAGRGLLHMGEGEMALTRAEDLVARYPDFLPGWDLLEQANASVERLHADDPRAARHTPDEVSDVRWRQRQVLGAMPGDPSRELWMSALAAYEEEDFKLARSAIHRALDANSEDLRFRLTQIKIYAAMRDWTPALLAMSRVLELTPSVSDSLIVERALELQRAATTDSPTPAIESLVREQRNLIAGRFPHDPLVALEFAKAKVAETASGPELGLKAALDELTGFRRRTQNVPLEDLRPGMTRAWYDFYEAYDARLAGIFAYEELKESPGSLMLLRLVAHSKARLAQFESARKDYEVLVAMLPFGEDARSLVRVLAESDCTEEEFDAALAQAMELERVDAEDNELTMARATFLLRAGPDRWDEALELLEALWLRVKGPEDQQGQGLLSGIGLTGAIDVEDADEAARLLYDVGRAFALALCWRGRPEDLERTQLVLDVILDAAPDAYERNLMTAIDHVTGRLITTEEG